MPLLLRTRRKIEEFLCKLREFFVSKTEEEPIDFRSK